MVGDGLDWVRVFGCGLEMGGRGCTRVGVGINSSGLNISKSGWEWG